MTRSIVGVVVVASLLVLPGAAHATLFGSTVTTVIGAVQPTAKSCTTYGYGYERCESSYGPVTSMCDHAQPPLLGSTRGCTVSVGDAGARCEESSYGSSRGSGSSSGCEVIVGDTALGCAEVHSAGPLGPTQRTLVCGPVGVPLDPDLP